MTGLFVLFHFSSLFFTRVAERLASVSVDEPRERSGMTVQRLGANETIYSSGRKYHSSRREETSLWAYVSDSDSR